MKESLSPLAEYVQSRSEEAFERLMKCYVDLVYSTAMRLVRGDSHLAEDIVQNVFLNLAKKANRLPPDVMLGGWLHQTTCFVAARMLRGERRRQLREGQAAELAMETNANTIFSEIAPILDGAVNQLREDDRKAILLRFYERLDFRRIGEQLGSNEDAAQKRVSRALDQLHSILLQRGISATLSVAALGTALAARTVEAAPVDLFAGLVKAGLVSTAAGHGATLTFLKGMTASKINFGVASAVVLALPERVGWL
jgi:RNA polymerase sigma factor (sigma-70 family)